MLSEKHSYKANISHFVLTLIICPGLETRRKYQSAETMKVRTACMNIIDTSRYCLQLCPADTLVHLPVILLTLKWNHQNYKDQEALDWKGIFIFLIFFMSL